MKERTFLIAALSLLVLACGETAPAEVDGRANTPPAPSTPRPPGSNTYGSFEGYWPTITPAEAAANAHRGAEILLGRALPAQAFRDAAQAALKDSDTWDGYPLGDGVLHVKYYTKRNDLRLTNEPLNTENAADLDHGDKVPEAKARELATQAFEQLAASGAVEAAHYGKLKFKVSTTDFLMGTEERSKTRRVTTQYRFLTNRQLNGIAFMNAGFGVSVHVSGKLSSLRFGGARVNSTMAAPSSAPVPGEDAIRQPLGAGASPLRERPSGRGSVFVGRCEEHQAKRRFQKDHPHAKVDWSELRYFLADDAQGPTLMEPLHVVTFANHYGPAVSRRHYVGYPVRDPDAPIVQISEAPTPDDTGDPRPEPQNIGN